MKKYETYFSGIDDKPLSFAIRFGNAFIFVLPIWLVVFLNRKQDIRNREGDDMRCQKSTSVK